MHLNSPSKACAALTFNAPKQVSKCLRYIISTGFTCLYSYKVNESVLGPVKKVIFKNMYFSHERYSYLFYLKKNLNQTLLNLKL